MGIFNLHNRSYNNNNNSNSSRKVLVKLNLRQAAMRTKIQTAAGPARSGSAPVPARQWDQ